MVTTRRQSKQLDQPPALPPVAPPKRKRSNDAICVPSAAQPPNQPSTKRRKRVKSTAKVETLTEPSEPTLAAPLATKRSRPRKEEKSDTSLARKPQENKARLIAQSKAKDERLNGAQQSVHVDLTNDDDSSDDAPRRAHSVGSQDTDGDDDDTDSRYALGSRRKETIRKGTKSKPRQTAELKFEEDGLEVVDKSKVAAANRKNGLSFSDKKPGSASWTPIDSTTRTGTDRGQQVNEKRMNLAKSKKTLPPTGVPCKHIMYTIAEAIAALSLYRNGTMSHPAEIDPVSRRPYEPLQTGESLSYPVKGTYNLGALGRYGIDTLPPSPFSLTVPLSEHSYIQTDYKASTAEPSRAGLGFSSTLPNRPRGPLVRRPNNYCFTFGKYRGRRMDSVPVEYLRSIFRSDDYHNDAKLQQAFADLYPKGLYESDAESYTFEKGGFKGKRLDEVPKSYLWGLLRKKKEGGEAGGKKGRSRLERALEVWEQGQLDLTKD